MPRNARTRVRRAMEDKPKSQTMLISVHLTPSLHALHGHISVKLPMYLWSELTSCQFFSSIINAAKNTYSYTHLLERTRLL